MAASSAGARSQPVVVSSSNPSSSDSESEPSGDSSGPASSSSSAISAGAAVARPTTDLLAVAPDRVDLAVVGDRAERLGEPPDRRRVRCVPLVEHRVGHVKRRPEIWIQVGESGARHQALVDDRLSRCRRHGHLRNRAARLPRRVLESTPSHDQPPLERRIRRAGGPRHDRLRRGRPRRSRSRAQRPRLERHARQRNTGMPASAKTRSTRRRAKRPASRPRGRNTITTPGCSTACGPAINDSKDRDNGQRDSSPVARLTVRCERPPVGQCPQPGQRQRQHPRTRSTAGIRHEPDPARVVLEPRVVQRGPVVSSIALVGGVHIALAAPEDVERPPPGWDGGRVDG